jgi:hypothetical protein
LAFSARSFSLSASRPGFQRLVFLLEIIDDRAQRVAAVRIRILKRKLFLEALVFLDQG